MNHEWDVVSPLRRLLTAATLGILLFVLSLGAVRVLARTSAPATAEVPAPAAPAVITRTWENLGLYGGIIAAVAIDPGSNAPTGTVYAGTTSGTGLYRSLDGGLTWEGVYTGSVQQLDVDTVANIVWGVSEHGVISSADGGATWTDVLNPLGMAAWSQLEVSGTVTVLGADNTVARSQDRGTSWVTTTLPCSGCQVSALSIDRLNDLIYAATRDEVYRSDISTLSFITSSGGVTSSHEMQDIVSLGASPHISGVVYAGTGDTGGRALYRSDNRGISWTKVLTPGGGIGYIVFHPVLTQTVFAGGQLFNSATFTATALSHGAGNSDFAIYPTVPYTMFGAIDQGINRSTDGGTTFYPTNDGIDGVVVQDFAQNPRDLGVFFVNTKNGIGRTFDGGRSWDFPLGYEPGSPAEPVGSHFGGAALAPYDSVTDTAKAFLGELYTEDYGDSTQELGSPSLRSRIEGSGCTGQCAAFINTIAADPGDPDRLYAAAGAHHIPPGADSEVPFGGLWESNDGGTTWAQNTSGYSAVYGTLPYTTPSRVVVFADDGLAYAALGDFRNGTELSAGTYGGVVSRTTGGGWNLLATITNPITSSVVGLAVDPNDPQHLWAGTNAPEPRLYRSVDGGLSWEDRTPPGGHGAFQAIAVHPQNSDTIFAASRNRVFYSDDAGMHWVPLPDPPSASAEAIQRILLPTLPPPPVVSLTGTVVSGGSEVRLEWSAPPSSRFKGVHIREDATAPPRTSIEGTDVISLPATTTAYTLPLSGDTYITVFPYDSEGRFGVGSRLEVSGSSVTPMALNGARVELLNAAEVARAAQEAETQYLFTGTSNGLYRMDVENLSDVTEGAISVYLPVVLKPSP